MSTTQTSPATAQAPRPPEEIRIYSHSSLFYWWPVWAVGLILGLLTLTKGYVMAVVPAGSKVKEATVIYKEGGERKAEEKEVIIPPEGKSIPETTKDLRLHITPNRGYGVFFAIVLLLVIVITNVPLRGMWSVMIIMLVIFLSIIFWLADWWDPILRTFRLLDIRMNTGAYFFISLTLLIIWAVTFFFFDRQIYITFLPGQFKVCLEIGAGEKTYDTIGMTIEKQRSDLFRHWFLGLGSGDLIVRTSGADRHEFRLNNVLFIGKRLQKIEEMQRIRQERSA